MHGINNKKYKKIGFFPITGDPIHYNHLLAAMTTLEFLNLYVVFIQVCGNVKHYKPNKLSKYHRYKMAKLAIAEYYPYLQYLNIDNDKLIGEEIFINFCNSYKSYNNDKLYYMAGIDNELIVLKRFNENKNKINRPFEIVFINRCNNMLKNFVCDGNKIFEKFWSPFLDTKIINCMDKQLKINPLVEEISSTLFREHKRIDIVPTKVLNYCKKYNLYGY